MVEPTEEGFINLPVNETFKYSPVCVDTMRTAAQEKEVPDSTVFWSIVGVVTIFVVVLAAVLLVRGGTTGQIVHVWENSVRPAERNPYACMDMPRCGSDTSFLCCAENPLPGTGIKCITPLRAYGEIGAPNYGYDHYGSGNPMCPEHMPFACSCPEKFQYRQTWPVPARY